MEHLVTGSLLLMLAVVVSGWVGRALPVPVPLPLIQILLGVLVSVFTHEGLGLEPHVFFLFFLPPLLFLDGWRIPKDGLFKDSGTIVELALGLVVFSVVGIGYLVHWMIPAMPLAVAFALAAALSPTDPVAVAAITKRTPLPRRLVHILEGESLLNDATGLVCMRFAVAAVITGSFSAAAAAMNFLWLALGGITIGVGTILLIQVCQDLIARRLGEEPGSKVLIGLLMPFAAYLAAEHLHASGILAAVAAGITMSYLEQSGRALPETRVRRAAVWDMVQFGLNGAMFVLLGEQLPMVGASAAGAMREAGTAEPAMLIAYILVVTLAMIALRFTWVWVSFRFTLFRRRRAGEPAPALGSRLLLATSFAGARGSITLAGIMTLPFLVDGAPFPGRDLAIFIAAGVVILSITLAGVFLPLLLKGLALPPEEGRQRVERRARHAAALAAMDAVERVQHDEHEITQGSVTWLEAAARVSADYRRRIEGIQKTGQEAEELRRAHAIERELRLAALRAERETYFRLGREGKVPDDLVRRLVAEIDHAETRLAAAIGH